MGKGSAAARALAGLRWAGVSAEERRAHQAAAGRAAWASLSPAERSLEMKRRAAVRGARRRKKA